MLFQFSVFRLVGHWATTDYSSQYFAEIRKELCSSTIKFFDFFLECLQTSYDVFLFQSRILPKIPYFFNEILVQYILSDISSGSSPVLLWNVFSAFILIDSLYFCKQNLSYSSGILFQFLIPLLKDFTRNFLFTLSGTIFQGSWHPLFLELYFNFF